MTEPFDENAPLTEDELQRLEHNALAMVAREYFSECPQCMLEAPLVVRALVELRVARAYATRRMEDEAVEHG